MVAKFIINGKTLQNLILGNNTSPIKGVLSYDGKTLQFLDCLTMEVRMTQQLKPITRDKALFRSKNFGEVERLGYDNYLVVIKGDVIEFYKGEEKTSVEIQGGDLL